MSVNREKDTLGGARAVQGGGRYEVASRNSALGSPRPAGGFSTALA